MLKKFQRKLSRKKKNSNNFKKYCIKIAKLHLKIKNQRNNFLHTLSSKLINENQIIYLEDLNIKGLLKNHKLAKNISDTSWSNFIIILKYKANWYEREIKQIPRFYPSSKVCSNCGFKKEVLELSERIYKCENCNISIDRDYNAALNILKVGQNVSKLNASGDERILLSKKEELLLDI